MFSPSELNANLHAELSSVLNAVHRAAFDDAEARGDDHPDPLLAVPVRLIPLVQTTRSMRRELRAQKARCALLSAVLDMLSDAVVVIDADRRVLLANARAHRVASVGESARFRFADPWATSSASSSSSPRHPCRVVEDFRATLVQLQIDLKIGTHVTWERVSVR